jgi:hypothetical protein
VVVYPDGAASDLRATYVKYISVSDSTVSHPAGVDRHRITIRYPHPIILGIGTRIPYRFIGSIAGY